VRLFIAIQIPDEIRAAFGELLQELRAIAPQGKWVRPENLHVTLKFLGNTDEAKLPLIKEALATVHSTEAVSLDFRGLGFFPNEKRARVFWGGMQASGNLAALAVDVDRAAHSIGFELETRAFTPHLTLARFDPPGAPAKLAAFAQENAARSFGEFSAREFHLIESKLKSTGAEYTTIHSHAFVAED